jgi:hypothetical protein
MKTSKHTTGFAAAVLFFLTTSAGGCALSVEAEVPEIEVTHRGLAFEGVPIAITGDVSVSKSFSQERGKLDFPEGLETEVTTLGVTLSARSGVADLSFIRHLRITMAASDGSAIIELGTYDSAPGGSPSSEITLTTLNPVNVLDAWNAESAVFTLDVAGTLPTRAWTADVTVRFAGKAKYSL